MRQSATEAFAELCSRHDAEAEALEAENKRLRTHVDAMRAAAAALSDLDLAPARVPPPPTFDTVCLYCNQPYGLAGEPTRSMIAEACGHKGYGRDCCLGTTSPNVPPGCIPCGKYMTGPSSTLKCYACSKPPALPAATTFCVCTASFVSFSLRGWVCSTCTMPIQKLS